MRTGQVAIPTIHLNGSSPERLLEDLRAAHGALREAQELLRNAAPNGRDFYPQGDAARVRAFAEHAERQRKLAEIDDEIVQILEGVQEQVDARNAQRRP